MSCLRDSNLQPLPNKAPFDLQLTHANRSTTPISTKSFLPNLLSISTKLSTSIKFRKIFEISSSIQVEIYNRLGTAPVPQKDLQHWSGTDIVPCQHWNLFWFSTGITPKSVLSRHLVLGLGLYYDSTASSLGPVPTVHWRHCSL